MGKLEKLLELDGRVYVHLSGEDVIAQFIKDATEEGFTFADGVKPCDKDPDDFYALNKDKTINYIGFIGRMAFYHAKKVGDEKLYAITL